MNNTSLSAGAVIRDILLDDIDVAAITRTVIPVFSPTEPLQLPYIVYRRTKLSVASVKGNMRAADSVEVEVTCYAASYAESIDLAEAVRAALDNMQATTDTLHMRCCTLVDSSEDYADDAFVQTLMFDVKV